MTEGFSSLANSLEAGISESLDEPCVLLLSLAHILTYVVFRDAGHDALKVMTRSTSGTWVVGMAPGQSTSSMSMEGGRRCR